MKSNRILLLLAATIGFVACETEEVGNDLEINGDLTSVSAVNLEVAVEEAEDALDDAVLYSGYHFGITGSNFSKSGPRGPFGLF